MAQLLQQFIGTDGWSKMLHVFVWVTVCNGLCCSSFHLLAIAVERRFAICNSLLHMRYATKANINKLIAVVWITSAIVLTIANVLNGTGQYYLFCLSELHRTVLIIIMIYLFIFRYPKEFIRLKYQQ